MSLRLCLYQGLECRGPYSFILLRRMQIKLMNEMGIGRQKMLPRAADGYKSHPFAFHIDEVKALTLSHLLQQRFIVVKASQHVIDLLLTNDRRVMRLPGGLGQTEDFGYIGFASEIQLQFHASKFPLLYGNTPMSEHLLHSIQLSTGLEIGTHKEKPLHAQLDFSLNSGEIMLLVGRNGVGKSVLLRTLAGMQAPLKGSVQIQGQALGKLSESQRAACVSMVLATPPQDLRLSVLEVVMSGRFRFASSFKGYRGEDESIARNWLNKMGLENWSDRLFLSLSDGEKQKVMLARCWAQDTPLLLLDEPLAFLDYPSRKEFLELLTSLCREQGKAAIYSSHDLSLSLQHCSSVLHLKQQGHAYYSDPSELSGDQWMLD